MKAFISLDLVIVTLPNRQQVELIGIDGDIIIYRTVHVNDNTNHKDWYAQNLDTGETKHIGVHIDDDEKHYFYKPFRWIYQRDYIRHVLELDYDSRDTWPENHYASRCNPVTQRLIMTMLEGRVSGDDIWKSLVSCGVDMRRLFPQGLKMYCNFFGVWKIDNPDILISDFIGLINAETTT